MDGRSARTEAAVGDKLTQAGYVALHIKRSPIEGGLQLGLRKPVLEISCDFTALDVSISTYGREQ